MSLSVRLLDSNWNMTSHISPQPYDSPFLNLRLGLFVVSVSPFFPPKNWGNSRWNTRATTARLGTRLRLTAQCHKLLGDCCDIKTTMGPCCYWTALWRRWCSIGLNGWTNNHRELWGIQFIEWECNGIQLRAGFVSCMLFQEAMIFAIKSLYENDS